MKVNTTGKVITFTFDDAAVAPITFDATKASVPMREYAEMHGWEQRLRDNAAIARKQKDGTVITVTEAMRADAVRELVTHYESGATVWTVKAKPAEDPTIRKIADKLGVTYAEAQAEVARKMLDMM